MIIWSNTCSCKKATCLNMWASPQTATVILYLQCTFISAFCVLAHRLIFWLACSLFLPAVCPRRKSKSLTTFLAFLEIRRALANGWWCMSRLTGYVRKFMVFQATGMCPMPVDLTKTPACTAVDSRPLDGTCIVELYVHSQSEAAGVCLISGICAA